MAGKADKLVKTIKTDKSIKAVEADKTDKAVKTDKIKSRRLSKSLRKHNRRLKEAARQPEPTQNQSQKAPRKPKAPADES